MRQGNETFVPGTTVPVTLTPVRRMKASEALRIGIAKRPLQAIGVFFDAKGGSCVAGAMYEGLGYDLKEGNASGWCSIYNNVWSTLHRAFPEVEDLYSLAGRNNAGESRESILQWLEERGW